MRFPGNCLIVSLVMCMGGTNKFRIKRNSSGRLHFYWVDEKGRAYEFYKKGASSKGYMRNAFYVGEIRRVG